MEIILFGAGRAGENLIAEYMVNDLEFKIKCVLDNDKIKWGRMIAGISIYNPEEVLTSSKYRYDIIMIASEYYIDIKKQLIERFNINQNLIKVAPKSMISSRKSYRPFEIPEVYSIANDILYDLCNRFNENELRYFVDHGTLLGLVRHGNIMTWDDDIDFSILEEDFGDAKDIFEGYFNEKFKNSKNINVEIEYQDDYFGRDKVIKALIYIRLKNNIYTIVVDLVYINFDKIYAYQKLTVAPKKYFLDSEYINYKNISVRVPFDRESYLSYHYGEDWRVVKKDLGWDMINNRIFKI